MPRALGCREGALDDSRAGIGRRPHAPRGACGSWGLRSQGVGPLLRRCLAGRDATSTTVENAAWCALTGPTPQVEARHPAKPIVHRGPESTS